MHPLTADDLHFLPRELRHGSAAEAGLHPEHVAKIRETTAGYMRPQEFGHPFYPSAVVLAARDGVIAEHAAMGTAVRYRNLEEELPEDQQIPAAKDTIYDMASITKLFTSVVATQQIENGRINLDKPVADYLPAFSANDKGGITVRRLLTHTSGLPAWMDLSEPEDPIKAVLEVKPQSPPGTEYVYSDVGLITLGKLLEVVDGRPLDAIIQADIVGPLRMIDTGFRPPPARLDRIAATEWQPDRGMVRGAVHDENAHALGGVAGHAGIFSTAGDMARFAQMVLNGGQYGGARILEEDSVRLMLTENNQAFPGAGRGLGWQLDQPWLMDAMTSPVTAGHTGFTGTSLVIDPIKRSFILLLTNRVHPTRDGDSINPARAAVARHLALAVHP